MNTWLYDEYKHCGVDYSKVEQAEVYDDRHQKFRDFRKEFDAMLAFLDLRQPSALRMVDMGCGTGAASILAASVFKFVYAVDVSEAMLAQAKSKAGGAVGNLTFVRGGFLTYRHDAAPVDLVITKMALHHLPDFWKQVALMRVNRMIKPGGAFYLYDVVFRFEPSEYRARIDAWVEGLAAIAGERFRKEIEAHIRDEYSTFDWIMKGMLERAGFAVEKERSDDGFLGEYACRKVREVYADDSIQPNSGSSRNYETR